MKKLALALSFVSILAAGALFTHPHIVSAQGYPQDAFNLQDTWNLTWGVKKVGIVASSVANTMQVFVNSANVLFVTSTGLGIGATPSNALSVTGNANVTGTLAVTGALTTTGSIVPSGGIASVGQFISVSSAATSNLPFSMDGMYTTGQIQAKTPTQAGQLIYNVTLANVCVSTGATVQGYKLVGTASTTCQ